MSDRLVIKIGGSVLADVAAMRRARAWLAATKRPGQTRLLIAGGGRAVDALRRLDEKLVMPATMSHWRAIELMDANTRQLTTWLGAMPVSESLETIRLADPDSDWGFPCGLWLRTREPALGGATLAASWDTTSDSIAARVAVAFRAGLVLLKHEGAVVYDDLKEAAEAGVVDPELPRIAESIDEVRLVGLQADG